MEPVNTQAVQTFSALLALGAIAGAVVLLVAIVAPGLAVLNGVREAAQEHAARFTLLLAGTAMIGSLYFSEVAHYSPCKLCWYQRVCMYAIAIVSVVAVVRRERRTVAPYVLTLSLVGLAVSVYHYLVEWFPQMESNVCSLDVPCTTIWFRKFGFLTLPAMAGVAFTGCALVMVHVLRGPADDEDSLIPHDTATEN